MQQRIEGISFFIVVTAILLSFAGGVLNGLIGTGGGLAFLLLRLVMQKTGSPGERTESRAESRDVSRADAKEKYTFSMLCVIPISFLSLFLYPPDAFLALNPRDLFIMLPAGLLGGAAGAILRGRIRAEWLSMAFALLTAVSGFLMIVRR